MVNGKDVLEINREKLVRAVEDMNKVMGLEPPIDVNVKTKELLEAFKEACEFVEPDDELKKETWDMVNAENCGRLIVVEKKESNKKVEGTKNKKEKSKKPKQSKKKEKATKDTLYSEALRAMCMNPNQSKEELVRRLGWDVSNKRYKMTVNIVYSTVKRVVDELRRNGLLKI